MKIFLIACSILFFTTSVLAQSLDNPTVNPNPPKSGQDKKAVAFVEAAVHELLEKSLADSVWDLSPDAISQYHDKNANCLKDESCLTQDGKFIKDLQNIQDAYGLLVEYRFPHAITITKKTQAKSRTDDEKLQDLVDSKDQTPVELSGTKAVRVFGRFTNQEGWRRVDFILGNPKKGLTLRQIIVSSFDKAN